MGVPSGKRVKHVRMGKQGVDGVQMLLSILSGVGKMYIWLHQAWCV